MSIFAISDQVRIFFTQSNNFEIYKYLMQAFFMLNMYHSDKYFLNNQNSDRPLAVRDAFFW